MNRKSFFGMVALFVALTFSVGVKAEHTQDSAPRRPIDLNNVVEVLVDENFEKALELCDVEAANAEVLDSGIRMTLARAESLEQLQTEYRFAFQVSSKRVYSQVRRLGVRVLAEIDTIATARGSLCQILAMSNLRGVKVIQGATKLFPTPGSTGSN